MPGGANNDISSIRIFGNAEVTVFRDGGLRGSSRRFSSNIRDLRGVGWNDRISSYRVDPRSSWGGNGGGAYGGGNYGGGYGGGYNGGYGGGGTAADRTEASGVIRVEAAGPISRPRRLFTEPTVRLSAVIRTRQPVDGSMK